MRPPQVMLHRTVPFAGFAIALALFILLAGWSGPNNSSMALDAIAVLGESLPWVALWLGAAAGFGWPVRRVLTRHASEPVALQLGFGVAVMLTLDAALGRLGALQIADGAGAWALVAIGLGLLVVQMLRRERLHARDETSGSPLYWCAAPAIAVLLLASTSAPGWLWDTEYGGYDALSYHLQLPREWMALSVIRPLEHNVYSFLPGFMEAAFHHLMVMRRVPGSGASPDPLAAAYACQLLHAAMAVLAAFVTARFVVWFAGPTAGAIVFVLVLGTPWVIVTGSLAYNEMPVLLMLATGLLLIQDWTSQHINKSTSQQLTTPVRSTQDSECRTQNASLRLGAGIGLLAGAACGAKLTAMGFVALPLVIVMLWNVPPRFWVRACAAGGVVALIVLASWLVSNGLATRNPVFPFATDLFGTGHWTAEQAATWAAGHQSDHGLGARLIEAWRQLARYGIGSAPEGEERWHAQWSILPWLALISIVVAIGWRPVSPRSVTAGSGIVSQLAVIMLVQLVFWLAATHVKSRFMLPMVIPAAASIAWMISLLRNSIPQANAPRKMDALLSAALVLWSLLPVWIFARQAQGMPSLMIGLAHVWAGDALDPETRATYAELRAVVHLNHHLPARSRVLFIGEAAPFYHRGDFIYTTTWDRGPLSSLLREHGDDDASAILVSLRREGYTHLLVNTVMLERWEAAAWNDPLITPEGIERLAEVIGTLEGRWPAGERLYRLRRPG